MRPTFLQFRNPKEKTPDPYDTRVTYNGRPLGYTRSKSPTFARGKRFVQYESEAKKTGCLVGPGSYNNSNSNKIIGAVNYKPLYGVKGDLKNWFYVGNILVASPEKTERKTESNWGKIDNSRPVSSSSKNYAPVKSSLKKPQKLSRNNNSTPKLQRIVFID